MKICDFIHAFKIALKDINKERNDAKGYLNKLEYLEKKYENIMLKFDNINELLEEICDYIPIEDRDTLYNVIQLIRYGRTNNKELKAFEFPVMNNPYINAWSDRIGEIYRFIRSQHESAKHSYEEKKYDNVKNLYESVERYIRNESKELHIHYSDEMVGIN
ncbi:MAG: hypothetical protein J6D03_03265 [Clostridia bacterium]|nr:hypothetical protein [Clostridia bacterium]